MKKPRVALVALHFAEYASSLAQALSKTCDVVLFLYKSNADNELGTSWPEWLKNENLRVIALERPRSVLTVFKNAVRLVSTIKRFRPDVVHFQEGIRDEMIFSLPFFRSVPKVLTVHDPSPHSGTDSKRLQFSRYRLYRRWMRLSADMAITHGASLCVDLEKVSPSLRGRTRSVAHGPLGATDGASSSVKPDALRLLFFGRIHEYKGLRYFVEAVVKLRNEGIPVIGVVAGSGGDLERYRSSMDAAGCFEVLDRYIPAPDVPKLFLAARVVVLPYTDGTQSGVAALALGYGRPVIASAVGSIPELVRHGTNGILVPPAETKALVDAIRSIVFDDLLWEELSAGARRLRDGELSWESIAAATVSIYLSLLPPTGPAEHGKLVE
jgi:starch synthase